MNANNSYVSSFGTTGGDWSTVTISTALNLPFASPNMPLVTDDDLNVASAQISLASQVANTLPISNGGTGSATPLTNGKLMWSSAGAIVEGTSASDPTFTTLTTAGNATFGGDATATGNMGASNLSGTNTGDQTISGTANQVIATTVGKTTTLTTPQDIATTSAPTFAGARITGLSPSQLLSTNATKDLVSTNVVGTANRVSVSGVGTSTITLSGPQDLAVTSNVVFNSVEAASVVCTGNGEFVGRLFAENLSGTNTGDETVVGTADQIVIASGGHTHTLSLAPSVTVTDLTLSSLTASRPLKTDAAKKLVSGSISLTSEVSGVLPTTAGGTGTNLTLSGAPSLLYNTGLGTIAEGTSPLHPVFWSVTPTNLSASTPVKSDANSKLVSGLISLTADVSGVLPVANGGSIGGNTGDVTLTAIGAAPNANGASLAGQVLTLQPASSTTGGVLTAGTQTIAGNKSFIGSIMMYGPFETQEHLIQPNYYLQMRNTAAQSIPNDVVQGVSFTASVYSGNWLPVYPTSSFTAPYAGRYLVTGSVTFAVNAAGHRYVSIWANGARCAQNMVTALAGQPSYMSVTDVVTLNVGNSVELAVYQDSGAALNISGTAGTWDSTLNIHYLHA